jgi:hypothetical protein
MAKIQPLADEIMRRFDGGKNLADIDIYADFISLCQSRGLTNAIKPLSNQYSAGIRTNFSKDPLPAELEALNFS